VRCKLEVAAVDDPSDDPLARVSPVDHPPVPDAQSEPSRVPREGFHVEILRAGGRARDQDLQSDAQAESARPLLHGEACSV
jgi:hypothetical protein